MSRADRLGILALLALVPAATMAQAPGEPITTTILNPAGPQAGEGSENRNVPVQAETGIGFPTPDVSRSRSSEPGATDSLQTGASPAPQASDPRDTDTAGAQASREEIPTRMDARPGEPGDTPAGSGARETAERNVPVWDTGGPAADPDEITPDAAPVAVPPAPAGSGATAVHELLTGLWREAVATGNTTLGFKAWLKEALDPAGPAPASRPDMPGTQAGRVRRVSERWRSRAGPVALGAAGRVVTTFGSAIPTAFCAPLTVCYIELEPGEILTGTPSWGDTVRWQVLVKAQGIDPETVVIEVKPAEDASITNLVIPTDRRLYTIDLVNDPEVHTPILSFLYPDSAARRVAEEIAAREEHEAETKATEERRKAQAAAARAAELDRSGVQTAQGPLPADRLDFGFRIDGKAPFRPVRVFADGRRTYIDLHPEYHGAMPVIIAGSGEGNAALNTRVTNGGTRLVADRVISDIWLQSGKKRVRVRKTGS